jgi:hypothetical protein
MIRTASLVVAALGLAVSAGVASAECGHNVNAQSTPVAPITTAQAPVTTPAPVTTQQ